MLLTPYIPAASPRGVGSVFEPPDAVHHLALPGRFVSVYHDVDADPYEPLIVGYVEWDVTMPIQSGSIVKFKAGHMDKAGRDWRVMSMDGDLVQLLHAKRTEPHWKGKVNVSHLIAQPMLRHGRRGKGWAFPIYSERHPVPAVRTKGEPPQGPAYAVWDSALGAARTLSWREIRLAPSGDS